MMILHLGVQSLAVEDNLLQYNGLITHFIDTAIKATEEYKQQYSSTGNIENAIRKFDEHLSHYQDILIAEACKVLFNKGVYDITEQIFAAKYASRYLDISEQITSVTNGIEEIFAYAEQLDNQLHQKQLSRGHWSGGGFGVAGAIKGAVTASAMNAVGGIFHGIGDMISSSWNNAKVSSMKEKLFKDPSTPYTLCLAVFHGCYNCFFGLRDELIAHNLLAPLGFKEQEAIAMKENALRYAENEQLLFDLLTKSICISPYTTALYEPLYQHFPDTNGLPEFAGYFHADRVCNLKRNLQLSKKLAEIDCLSESTVSDQYEKLIKYLSLSTEFRYDAEKELNNLANSILRKNGNSISDIEKALDYITSRLPVNFREPAAPIIRVLNAREIQLKQQKDRKSIKSLGSATTEDWCNQLKAVVKFSEEYHSDETEQIVCIIKEIAKRCVNPTEVKTALNSLSDESIWQCSQIQIAVKALHIRYKIAQADIGTVGAESISFSPTLLDVINNARNGNVTCQQWLVKFFFQDNLTEENISDDTSSSAHSSNGSNHQSERHIDTLCYLFDKPEKYPFDLFMRLKYNSQFISHDEYVDALSTFSDCEKCVAGMYEYGKCAYDIGKKHLGVQAIMKAADIGHCSAIEFMYNLCVTSDSTSKASLFYQVLLLSDKQHKELNEFESQYRATCDVIIDGIYDIVFFENNYFASGSSNFSHFLGSLWHKFDPSKSSSYSIGVLSGSPEVQRQLKKARSFLEIPKQEIALFSYTEALSSDDKKILVFTQRAIYWNKGNTIYTRQHCTPSQFAEIANSCVARSQKTLLLLIYSIIYYSCTLYRPDMDTQTLEKMAYCGHPLAICNLMVNSNYYPGEDKRDVWKNLKRRWESSGVHFSVCPRCLTETDRVDVFCPNCGQKL